MYNNSIEDIMIDKNFNNRNKNNKPVLMIFIFFIILLVIAGGVFAYFNIINKKTNKELFFNGLINANLNFFLENETYREMAKKFSSNSFEMNNDITFSTNIKDEEQIETTDYSKYLLKWTAINNVENEENFNEFNISYSDNQIFDLKVINNKDAVAVISGDIVNKYVGVHKNNINTLLQKMGVETALFEKYEDIKTQVSVSKIDLDDTAKQEKKDEYKNLILSKLPEEKFTKQENQISLVKENSKEVIVEAYKLSLTQEEVNTIVKDVLTNFRNDEDFIGKIVTNKSEDKVEDFEETQNQLTTNEVVDNIVTDNGQPGDVITEDVSTENVFEENISSDNIDVQNGQDVNDGTVQTLQPIGTEMIQEQVQTENSVEVVQEIVTDQITEISSDITSNMFTDGNVQENSVINNSIDSIMESEEKIEEESLKLEDILPNLLLGRKIDTTVENLQKSIDEIIENLSDDGIGLEVTVYVSELATEKVSIVLPDESTIDIEFEPKSEDEKNAIITYLYKQEVVEYNEDNMAVYSATTENTIPENSQNITDSQTNGIKLEISKSKNEASTTTKTICSIIENKKINEKIIVDVITKGTASSKKFDNDIDVTYSDNSGEVKVNLKNEINFDKVSEIEKLTDENCLFLDTLEDAELTLTIAAITNQIKNVYESKMENLTFIDTNTQAPDITKNTQNRDELRNLLVTTISTQMGEALNNGLEYNLQNLQNLQIQNHIVSVVIENDVAIVSVDGLKFKIDANFNLTDAE